MPDVRFNLKDRTTNKETLINLFFRYNNKRLKYSTSQKIPPQYWDDDKQRAKRTNKFPQYSELNSYLDKLETLTKNTYRRFLNDDKIPSIQEFKKELDIGLLKKEQNQKKTLFNFIDGLIEERSKLPKYNQKTISYYNVVSNIIKDYTQQAKITLDFQDVTLEFYYNFLEYLYNKRGFSINYAGNIIKVLKVFLNDATEKGINTNLAFRGKHFLKPKQDTDSIYLTINELNQIYQLDLSSTSRLERVRDLFILGCYTGLRFSDFTVIEPQHITNVYDENGNQIEVIKIVTKKTATPVIIPLHPFVKAILNKYDGSIPKPLSNQKMNDYIKEVVKLAGIDEQVQLTKSKSGKRIEITKAKWELTSTHTARRSFATNAFKSGVSSLSIMRITGHKTESAFMKYIKVTNEENALLMAKNRFFKEANVLSIAK